MTTATRTREVRVVTRLPHAKQEAFRASDAKRKIVRAGRRGGKTVGVAILAIEQFAEGRRVLYTAPTSEQTDAFWFEIKRALQPLVDTGVYKLNEAEDYIERKGTQNRIKCKTAWNADTLRGDYADLLILDEWQLTNEDAWEVVGAPMLLDNNGDAIFIYTPPSLRSAGVSKARDPRHASKMFKAAQEDTTGRWQAFHFTSMDNPFISQEALALIAADMSRDSYRREILAEDDEIELSWLVYQAFNEDICKVKRFDIPLSWPIFSGHDFGSANPAALLIAEARLPLPSGAPATMRRGDLVIWREYAPGAGRSIATHVDAFKELTRGYTMTRAMGGAHQEDEIRQGYTAQGWPMREPVLDRVNAQVDRVIGLFEQRRLFVFSDLWMTLAQLANCLWVLGEDGQPTNKIADEAKYHLLAALRYLGSSFAPVVVAGAAPHEPVSYQ